MAALTTHRRVVVAVLVLATVIVGVVGAGAPMIEEDSNLGRFESNTEAANASAFIEETLVAEGAENQTTVQVIRRGEDVLTPETARGFEASRDPNAAWNILSRGLSELGVGYSELTSSER
jgi:hypothetical protein